MEANNNNNQPQQSAPEKLPPVKQSAIVEWGYRYHSVVIMIVCLLAAFGIYALKVMDKNEFPDFTIREGVLAAVYPGTTATEMEDQVMKPMEDYIFSFKEVDKTKTRTNAQAGIVMSFIELKDDVHNTDQFWAKFNLGLDGLKRQLPSGVLGMELISNFGETSSILLTMQSDTKTYRELSDYMDDLKDCLRGIKSVGAMTVSGMQHEQISVTIDPDRLSRYAIDQKTIAATLFSQDFKTTGGDIRTLDYTSPVIVKKTANSVKEIEDLIVLSLPTGQAVRLSDVADVKLEYPDPDSYITNNTSKCLLLSIEMAPGNNVVEMGKKVSEKMEEFEASLPSDITLFEITNQPQVVNSSVDEFLKELLIAVIAVVIAIMLLLPMRVALVAAATIPITIFVSLAFFYLFDFELNTVTLAVLILSLGMIVDNSVVIIDDYVELLGDGMDPVKATIRSASEFFKSIFSATLAISVTFFPFLITITGMFRDFLNDFPWAITIILVGSFFIAELLVPFLQYVFIRPEHIKNMNKTPADGKKHFSMLRMMQSGYDTMIEWCFSHPWITTCIAMALTVVGGWIMFTRPVQMMPIAERNQFAVEIFLPTGSSLHATDQVADSLEKILSADKRVVSVANFHGCSSPRFQATYAPQVGGPNFAQFIVNTVSDKATEEVLHEYTPKYSQAFPGAVIRFKQLSYNKSDFPVEVKVSGENFADIQMVADTVMSIMRHDPDLMIVRSSMGEPLVATRVNPDPVQMSRLGLNTAMVELDLALRYSTGVPVGTVWDGDYPKSVVLKSTTADRSNAADMEQTLVHTPLMQNVQLGHFSTVEPMPTYGQLTHLGGIRTTYVTAEVPWDKNVMDVTTRLKDKLDQLSVPSGITISYAGDYENTEDLYPQIFGALALAVVIIFLILLQHYKKIGVTVLLCLCIIFCIPGTGISLLIQGVSISITCVLGVISLMGILVRNVIIMIDYAEELQADEGYSLRDAILESAKRRMRPIFLTSAAASMGVIPMVLGKSPLWMPMGTVIFWGTIITMFFILTIIPILYWKTQKPVNTAES